VATLLAARTTVVLDTLERWDDLEDALRALVAQREADAATSNIASHVSALELRCRSTSAPPELGKAATALSARNADDYDAALSALADAHMEKADQRRCDELYTRLLSAHPDFAQLIAGTATATHWDTRVGAFLDAWAWGKARTFFDNQRRPDLDARLDAELSDAVARVEAATVKLAAAEAWGHALARMNAEQVIALRTYRQHMSDRGAGKGRYAHKFEAAARGSMIAARGAVPA